MSVVLFVLGVAGAVAGVVMVAFGIPNNEFSVGNTLIIAGTTSAVGSLILVGLSAAVAQLQQIAENLNHGAAQRDIPRSGRASQPADFLKSVERAPQGAGSVPFPSRPKPQSQDFGQDFSQEFPKDLAKDFNTAAGRDEFASVSDAKRSDWEGSRPLSSILRDEPEFDRSTDADEATLSPAAPSRHVPMFEPLKPADMPAPQRHPETVSRAPAAERSAPVGVFDGMWSNEARPEPRQPARPQPRQESRPAPAAPGGKSAAAEAWKPSQPFIPPAPAKPETKIRDQAPVPARQAPAAAEPRAAVLKSGTVDGMGYTLYVDGSIEAELPQGTLRFASIAELRSHLEQNS